MILEQRVYLVGLLLGLLTACTSTPIVEDPPNLEPGERVLSAYEREVLADAPLAHWRMNGAVPGAILGDADNATAFTSGQERALEGADFGGSEIAVELWGKDVGGELFSFTESGSARAALVISVASQGELSVALLGTEIETGARLEMQRWQLIGVSWRSADGLMVIAVDGAEVWRGNVAQGELVPYDGRLRLGPLRGAVDEVAVFDRFKHPSHWLHRARVAMGRSTPSHVERLLPSEAIINSGHIGTVYQSRWSPDGALIASAGRDGNIKLWDPDTGLLLRTLQGHTADVNAVQWSPDGALLASGSTDGSVRVWDPATGVMLHTLNHGNPQTINTVQWSPDGTWLASNAGYGSPEVWDLASGTLRHPAKDILHVSFSTVDWSPDGGRLASGSTDGSVRVWDASTGESLFTLDEKTHLQIAMVRWSLDGLYLAAARRDGVVKVWDASTGKLLHTLKGHDKRVNAVAWSAAGLLASGSSDGTVRVWDPSNGALLHLFEGPAKDLEGFIDVEALGWSPDGARIASGSWDKTVSIWDLASGKRSQWLTGHTNRITSVHWSTDGDRLTSSGGGVIMVWDPVAYGEPLRVLKAQAENAHAIQWSPNGARMASVHGRSVKVWDPATGKRLHDLAEANERVKAACWSPDGALIAAGGAKGSLTLWDPSRGRSVRALKGHTARVNAVQWRPDGARLVSGAANGTVLVWDPATGEQTHAFKAHADDLWNVRWSPTGALLATSGREKAVKVWDSETGALLHELSTTFMSINILQWSPDGAQLAASGASGVVWIWDLATSKVRAVLKTQAGSGFVQDLQWSPDGRRIALASIQGDLQVWDPTSGRRLYQKDGRVHFVNAVKWRPDGARLVSAGADGAVKLWDPSSGELVQTLEGHAGRVSAVQWSPDGAHIASTGIDGTLRLWNPSHEVPHRVSLVSGEDFWLAVTDAGYFSGTLGAPLAITQGTRSFSIGQLSHLLNRPDKVLEALSAPKSHVRLYRALWLRRLERLGLAPEQVSGDFSSAPSVRIVSIMAPNAGGQSRIQVVFEDQVGLLSRQVYVNGVPITAAPVAVQGTRQRLTIPVQLTRGANQIEVTAFNTEGVESLRASTTIDHDGEGLPAPRLFFLGFGVSEYRDEAITDLEFAHQDAVDLERTLKAAGQHYAAVQTRIFTNEQVTDDALGEAHKFLSGVTEHDTLVMFIAGHGVRGDDEARTYYYADHDTEWDKLASTAIPFASIEALLYTSKARKKLFLIDTCESGDDLDLVMARAEKAESFDQKEMKARSVRGFMVGRVALTSEVDTRRMLLSALRERKRLIMQDLNRRSGAIVLASSLGTEYAYEHARWSNGAFTEELLRALQTDVADANGDGLIDTDELKTHVMDAVPGLTGDRQHPNVERDNDKQRFALPIVVGQP